MLPNEPDDGTTMDTLPLLLMSDDDDDDALTVYASHEVAPLHDVLTAYHHHASLEVGQDHDDWLLRLQRCYVD